MIYDGVVSVSDYAFYNCRSLTICCYSDTQAHRYAVENNVPFILLEGTLGDIDGDGEITSSDAMIAIRQSIGISSGFGTRFSDFDGDGDVTAADALAILRKSIGMQE